MSRATLEVADIIHTAGDSFWQQHGPHLAWSHRKALDAVSYTHLDVYKRQP